MALPYVRQWPKFISVHQKFGECLPPLLPPPEKNGGQKFRFLGDHTTLFYMTYPCMLINIYVPMFRGPSLKFLC